MRDYKENEVCEMCGEIKSVVHKASITGTYICSDCLYEVYGNLYGLVYCEDCGQVFNRGVMRDEDTCYSCHIKSLKRKEYKRLHKCVVCNDNTTTNYVRVEGKNVAICKDCVDNHVNFSYCKVCGKFHKLSDMDMQLHKVCKKCKAEKKIGKCVVCSVVDALDDNNLCTECSTRFKPCSKCGSIGVNEEVDVVFKDYEGKSTIGCSVCANQEGAHFSRCAGCKTMSSTIVDGFCSDCRHERGIAYLHNWRYRPPVFIEYGVDDFHFGIENEFSVKNDTSRQDVISQLSKLFHERVAYIQHDGSVYNGGELVTHPMSFSQIKGDKQGISRAFEIEGIVPHNSTGMHIHISKSAFTIVSLYKFMKFISDNREFIELIAERKSGGGRSSWSFDDKCVLKNKAASKSNSDKYVDVNLTHPKSVEVRIFKGATKFEQLLKNVEFCHALATFSKNCGVSTPSMEQFLEYIKCNSGKYDNLLRFLSNLDDKMHITTPTQFNKGDSVVMEDWERTQISFGMADSVLNEVGIVDSIHGGRVVVDFPSFHGFSAHPDDLVCIDRKPVKLVKDKEFVKTIKSILLGGE